MTDVRKTTPKGFQPTRRKFISSAASTAFGFTLVPRHVLGGPGYIAPSEQLQVAGIGAGGMGGGDIATVSRLGANFVALCDVDDERAAGTFNAHPKARRYSDRFRNVLTILPTRRSAGAAGRTSAPVHSETWDVTLSIIRCGHSNSELRRRWNRA